MAAFWAVLTFGGSGPALTAHGSLDLKQEIQIQIINNVGVDQTDLNQGHSFHLRNPTEDKRPHPPDLKVHAHGRALTLGISHSIHKSPNMQISLQQTTRDLSKYQMKKVKYNTTNLSNNAFLSTKVLIACSFNRHDIKYAPNVRVLFIFR
jgi:hypothetical protein